MEQDSSVDSSDTARLQLGVAALGGGIAAFGATARHRGAADLRDSNASSGHQEQLVEEQWHGNVG
ncbi:hypothetical protein NL676_001873, partial [Syzygium grande]